jgi:hypothetical protein
MISLRQQPDQVSRGPLVVSSLVVVGTILLCLGTVWLLERNEPRVRNASPPAVMSLNTPFEEATLAERQARAERDRLAHYGWVDRSRGLVHIPVEVAARLYLRDQATEPRGAP